MAAEAEQVNGGAPGVAVEPSAPSRRRWRRPRLPSRATGAVLLGLLALSLAQRPGRVTFDTKLDLALAPAAFLGRALHLWNPEATFGELQNQAYGYLFPVGPFFAAGDVVGLPAWLTQRLWCALLLCTAFLGTLLLARALRLGSEPARYLAALGYALAPRMLTEIGPVSAEMLPAVLLPWVLLPLVRADRLGSPRRAAALSGLAVLAMGGVNASMVLMVLTLPAIWLLTRHWTAEHGRLIAWWCAAVLAATLWWIVPLLLLAGYSLPFLDYIESAANTTAPLSLFQVLRGTNQWVAYVVQGEPWWPAGFLLVDNPALMAATMLLAGVGLLGLARRGLPERTFLLLGMLTGLALLTVGHVGPLDSPFAQWSQQLLDGPLAPFRNVHKFDPVLRLTLMLGFAHAVSRPVRLPGLSRLRRSDRWRKRGQLAVAAVLVLAVAAPAWLLVLRPGPGWADVPVHWRQVAQWLAARDATSRALMLPATGFGEYRWGRTVDEPLQALAQSPWAVRSQIPLGSEGNTRFMDTVSDALADGRGSPALADYLARAGVRFLVLRNDVDRSSGTLPPVAVLHQALARSPGIRLAVVFGQQGPVAEPAQLSRVDRDAQHPALQVYEVDGPVLPAVVASAHEAVTVSGGPESVLTLLEQGLLRRDQAAVLAGDSDAAYGEHWVVTDGLRRRERNVGRVRGNLSQTLAETDPIRQERPTLDVLPFAGAQHQTVAQYDGVRAVTASTSGGYADAFGESDPSLQPFSAVDGDPASTWRSSSLTGPVGEWLQVQLDTPRVFDTVSLDFVQDIRVGWPVARIRITTDRGSIDHDVPDSPGAHSYPVFAGPTARLRVTVLAMRGGRENGNVAVRELTIPGVAVSRMLRTPADSVSTEPVTLAFTRGSQPRAACFSDGGPLRCDPDLVRAGEEPSGVDRRFRLTRPALYSITGTALPRLGARPWGTEAGLTVTATSQLAGDPAVSARMAFDGDRSTAWVADVTDPAPTLTLRWRGQRSIDRLSLEPSDLDVANPPIALQLRSGDQTRSVQLGDGRASVSFEPLRGEELHIVVQSADQLPFAPQGARGRASAALAELRVPALATLLPATPQTLAGAGCGFGPRIEVDGKRYDTSVLGSPDDLTGYRPLRVLPCAPLAEDGLPLQAGEHRIRTLPSDDFVVHDLTLRPVLPEPAPGPAGRELRVLSWGAAERTLQVSDGPDSYLFVPENANPGWTATIDGRQLRPARVDGWQQAWLLPAGASGTVRLAFEPDQSYRAGLLAGALAVVALLVAALLPARRRQQSLSLPSRSWWAGALPIVVLLLLLGGPVPLIALLGCLVLRRLWPGSMPVVSAGAVLAATAVAVAGRLTGHGQAWAFGGWVQALLYTAVAAVIAAFLYPAAATAVRPTPSPASTPAALS